MSKQATKAGGKLWTTGSLYPVGERIDLGGGGEETDWDGTHGVDATKSDSGRRSFLVPSD